MPRQSGDAIRLRRGRVREILQARPGAREVAVDVDGETSRAVAIAYPDLVGEPRPGDEVLLNTSAVALRLGTGGLHIVVAILAGGAVDAPRPTGRIVKLRYTPHQLPVHAVEEPDSADRAAMVEADGLAGAPVVWVSLHSLVATAVAGAVAAGARRVAYVMTDGAALPAPLSRLAHALRSSGLVASIVTAGQAFGGDLEAVSVFSGLLAARHVVGADVVVVADGPGNAGTATRWGSTAVASAASLNAAAALGGRPVAGLRVSFAESRTRHRVVSHHSITALGRVALAPVHVAVPAIEDEGRRSAVWAALTEAGLAERHQLVEVTGAPALDLLGRVGVEVDSMGRRPADDPEFFLAGGAAGVLAGRMAAGDRAWNDAAAGRSATT